MIIGLGISYDNKHLLIIIGIRVINARRFGIVFYYVMSLRYRRAYRTPLQREHRPGCVSEDVVSRNQLNLVADENDLASSMGLDVLFLNVLTLVVKQPMRVSGPCHAPHIHLKHGLLLLNGRLFAYELLHHLMMLFLHRYELIRVLRGHLLVGKLLVQKVAALQRAATFLVR